VVVARFFFCVIAIRYVLPFLWMTSRLAAVVHGASGVATLLRSLMSMNALLLTVLKQRCCYSLSSIWRQNKPWLPSDDLTTLFVHQQRFTFIGSMDTFAIRAMINDRFNFHRPVIYAETLLSW